MGLGTRKGLMKWAGDKEGTHEVGLGTRKGLMKWGWGQGRDS